MRSWLTSLPINEHGLSLHKGLFRDTLALQYSWQPADIPADCSCGKAFSVQHALPYHKEGFSTLRHNEVRDLTASLLTEVCSNVAVEPGLQQLSGEELSGASAIGDDGAQMDVAADGFWGHAEKGESLLRHLGLQPICPLQQTVIATSNVQEARTGEKTASTFSAFVMLRRFHSPHWFSHLLVEWLGRPGSCINVLPPCWLRSRTSPTAPQWTGYDVPCPTRYLDLSFSVFMAIFIPLQCHKIW